MSPLNTQSPATLDEKLWAAEAASKRLKESLDLCENENDKARRIILWCAERLPKEHMPELRKMIQSGVSVEQAEEDREELLRLHKSIEKITDLVQEAIDSKGEPPASWYQKADAQAEILRGFLPSEPLPKTLHEIRNAIGE
ncbi:hypothetical protein ACD578_05225 [Microvirga sp. RSM25]|uniref:hypothetical protein n=1 Tax=Microvirga sp. RSM25 TaxID=3273802 RepID=UPI00384D66CD